MAKRKPIQIIVHSRDVGPAEWHKIQRAIRGQADRVTPDQRPMYEWVITSRGVTPTRRIRASSYGNSGRVNGLIDFRDDHGDVIYSISVDHVGEIQRGELVKS